MYHDSNEVEPMIIVASQSLGMYMPMNVYYYSVSQGSPGL
jgi:hypothetical protein